MSHAMNLQHFNGAASRPDAPPIPLQGVWTRDDGDLAPWKGDFHHDLNTQMTYLAYHTARWPGPATASRGSVAWRLAPDGPTRRCGTWWGCRRRDRGRACHESRGQAVFSAGRRCGHGGRVSLRGLG